jgi:hypothetical protein
VSYAAAAAKAFGALACIVTGEAPGVGWGQGRAERRGAYLLDLLDPTHPPHPHMASQNACIAVAGPEASTTALEGHQLFVVRSESTLTFEHTYTWLGELLFLLPAIILHGRRGQAPKHAPHPPPSPSPP